MYCPACGYHDSAVGGRHTCVAQEHMIVAGARRPAGWQYLAGLVVVVSTACAVAIGVQLALLAGEARTLGEPGSDVGASLARLQRLVGLQTSSAALYQLAVFGFVAALVAWFTAVRRLARRHGEAGGPVLRHWTVLGWRVALLAFCALAIASIGRGSSTPSLDDPGVRAWLLAFVHRQILYDAGRLVLYALLVVSVWALVPRMRALESQSPLWTHATRALNRWRARRTARRTAAALR